MSVEEEACPATLLHKLAYECNWNGLKKRLSESPDEALATADETAWMTTVGTPQATITDDDLIIEATNLSPLHILVTRRDVPIDVLEAFVAAAPTCVQLLTSEGRSALHLACYAKQTLEMIGFLARACPDSILWQDSFDHWNGFHTCVYCDASKGVISAIMDMLTADQVKQAMAMQDKSSKSPVALACQVRSKIEKHDFSLIFQASSHVQLKRPLLEELARNYRTVIGEALKLKPPPKKPVSGGEPSLYSCSSRKISVQNIYLMRPMDSFSLWKCLSKMFIVLGMTDENMATYPLLHECIRRDVDCKTSFFYCLLSLNPSYALHMDASGDLPIHVLSRSNAQINTREFKNRLASLIVAYPRGASVVNRKERKLCLELLDSSTTGASWDLMKTVLRSCPVALSRLGLQETLYCHILAKLMMSTSGRAYPNTVYTILKETPSLFE